MTAEKAFLNTYIPKTGNYGRQINGAYPMIKKMIATERFSSANAIADHLKERQHSMGKRRANRFLSTRPIRFLSFPRAAALSFPSMIRVGRLALHPSSPHHHAISPALLEANEVPCPGDGRDHSSGHEEWRHLRSCRFRFHRYSTDRMVRPPQKMSMTRRY